MKIVVTGGTGFIGKALVNALLEEGHHLVVISRNPRKRELQTGGVVMLGWEDLRDAVSGAYAVVNLAGESVASGRWTPQVKERILHSRLEATQRLIKAMEVTTPSERPKVFVSASAVGYYGDGGHRILTEKENAGSGFLAKVCIEWEQLSQRAPAGIRVVNPRIGVVLHPSGGALQKMKLPFSLGLGGSLGQGGQYMPWIHLSDMIRILKACIQDERFEGAINAVAPNPVTMDTFAATLARVLHRPAVLGVPQWALSLALGEAASVLTGSQRVIPERLNVLGFTFEYAELEPALKHLMAR